MTNAFDRQIPVTVLTGFLGSGKTTVLNRLLHDPAMAGTLVVINELGEVALDHDLVEAVTDDMIVLQGGCLCCSVRSDLAQTLGESFLKRMRGDIPRFSRVVIETTGLADPAPILQTLMTDSVVAIHFRLDGVVATVDAATGEATLDRHIEAVKQAAMADRILLTKTDLVSSGDVVALEGRVRALNPGVPILRAVGDGIEPKLLFEIGLYNPATKSLDAQRWLGAEAYEHPERHDHAGHAAHEAELHASSPHDSGRHDARIRATCLVLDQPIPGAALDRWLDELFLFKGPDLLRFKAIVHVAELDVPLVLHGVQHVIHPPLTLKAWPSADRRTRMVLVTRDIDVAALRESLREITEELTSTRA